MRRLGFTDAQIEAIERRQEELLAGDDREDEDEAEDEFDGLHPVLEENWPAAQIFLRLNLARQLDQGVVIYTGIETAEITRWLKLWEVPTAEWIDTIERVQVLVNTACQEMNRRTSENVRRQMDRERARTRGRKK